MQRSLVVSLIGIATLFLFACTDKPETDTTTSDATTRSIPNMRPVQPATGPAVSAAPWLRTVLPESVVVYARIPSIWGLISVPGGTVFDRAMGSKAYIDSVKSIRSGFVQNLLPELGDEIEPLWHLLLAHARSPVELAVLAPADKQAPMPEIILSVQLDFDSVDKLNQFLQQAAKADPVLEIRTPVGADGRGNLLLAGLPAFVRFDQDSGRLVLLAGSANSAEIMDKRFDSLNTVTEHRMYKLESEIDSSGQGLFVWMDAQRLMTMGQSVAPALGVIAVMGSQNMKSVAFGMGSSGGKQRATVMLEMPATGLRSFIPLMNADTNVKAAGELRGVIMLGIPQEDDLKRIESQLSMMISPDSMQNYFNAMTSMKEELGFEVKDVLNALGPEMIMLFDGAGSYLAVRLRDPVAFDNILVQLQKHLGITLEKKVIGGREYQHIAIPNFPDAFSSEEKEELRGVLLLFTRLFQLPSHFYWTKEDGYLLISGTPQPLIDRYYLEPGMTVGSWLKEQQKVDPNNSLLLASGKNQGLPALMYELNLQVLLALGDLVERPVDLFALPTAREAGIPEYGGISFKIDSSETRLAMQFSYDNNPAELLFGSGGMAAVATTGVLAAIAVPAYQDYTIRARVVEGLTATEQPRAAVEQFILNKQRLPTSKESKALLGAQVPGLVTDLTYDDKSGAITITLAIEILGDNNLVLFTPKVQDDGIIWICSSEIQNKYLPKSCRIEN